MANYKVTYPTGSTTLNTILVPGTGTGYTGTSKYKSNGTSFAFKTVKVTGASPFSQQGAVGYQISGTDITTTYKLVMPIVPGPVQDIFTAINGGNGGAGSSSGTSHADPGPNGAKYTVYLEKTGASSSVTSKATRIVPSWAKAVYLLILGSAGGGGGGANGGTTGQGCGGGGGGGAVGAYKLQYASLPIKIVLGGGGGGGGGGNTSGFNQGGNGVQGSQTTIFSKDGGSIAQLFGGHGGVGGGSQVSPGGTGGSISTVITGATGVNGDSGAFGGGGGSALGGSGGKLDSNYVSIANIQNRYGGHGKGYTSGGGEGGAGGLVQIWYYF